MQAILTHVRAALYAGWRIRSSQVVFFLALFAMLAAWVGGSFSPRQPETVMFDVGFSLIRVLGAVLAVYWVQELIAKDVEKKTVYWICAAPSPRSSYLIGRYVGITLMLMAALLLMGGMLHFGLSVVAPKYHQPTPIHLGINELATFLYLWLDLLVITAFVLLISCFSTTAMLPFFMGVMFVVISRALGPTLSYLMAQEGGVGSNKAVLDGVQWILPDLSRFDIRDAVLYGQWPHSDLLYAVPIQAFSFVSILLIVACYKFKRREFA